MGSRLRVHDGRGGQQQGLGNVCGPRQAGRPCSWRAPSDKCCGASDMGRQMLSEGAISRLSPNHVTTITILILLHRSSISKWRLFWMKSRTVAHIYTIEFQKVYPQVHIQGA